MKTLFLEGDKYQSASELHEALQRMLNLPRFYGMNADAFHDSLAERRMKVSAMVFSKGHGEVAKAMDRCIKVLRDLGGTVQVLCDENPDAAETSEDDV